MKKVGGLFLFPITAVLLLIAAVVEPTFGGEVTWIWWLIAALGGFSVFGWALGIRRKA